MSVINEPNKWYIKLFTLGKNFSSRTFSDNFKKFLLNGLGLFVVVTFTFYVENLGDEYETKQKYIEVVKEISYGMQNILDYSKLTGNRQIGSRRCMISNMKNGN